MTCTHSAMSGTTLERRPTVRYCSDCNTMTCSQCGEQFFSNRRLYKPKEWPVTFSSTEPCEWVAVYEPIPQPIPCSHGL